MKLRLLCFLPLALLGLGWVVFAQTQKPTPSPTPTPAPQPSHAATPAQEVPVMDGGAGPCALELTVTDGQGKGVYAATVKVHMAYGFAGIRKLDLEAGTNWDGKVTFKGLPARVRNPPLEFRATKDQLSGMATYNPVTECQAKHDIVLEKPATRPAESSK